MAVVMINSSEGVASCTSGRTAQFIDLFPDRAQALALGHGARALPADFLLAFGCLLIRGKRCRRHSGFPLQLSKN